MLPAAPGLLSGDWQRPLQAPSHTPPHPSSKATATTMPRVSILLSKGQFWELPQSYPQTWQGREGAASGLPPPEVPSPSEEMRLLWRLRVRRLLRRDSSL